VDVAVFWEGRALQAPNVDALDRLRKTFPDIPLTHFVNPVYFLDVAKAEDNTAALQKIFTAEDEVGLYLAPIEALVKQAGVTLKLSPTFWGYTDEGDVCDNDCGLDVPLTVYDREESLRLLSAAHATLDKVGFTELRSFVVRGWMEAPYLTQLAAAFGYRYDLSPVNPLLVTAKLREFPISYWVTQRWGMLIQGETASLPMLTNSHPKVRAIPQRGGILDLNEQREILARFDHFIKEPLEDEVFTLSLSVESAFQSWPRLRAVLQGMNERAKEQNISLRYATVSGVKNSRPTAPNVRISTRFSQQTEARK
jgi:hypothetical protein